MKTVICPYCGTPARMVKGAELYPNHPNEDLAGKNFYRCAPCDAHVGCHAPNPHMGFAGTEPLGRMANFALRRAKNHAHRAFDPLWKQGFMKRRQAYAWLAQQLGIALEECHIGMFDIEQCRRVTDVSKKFRLQHQTQFQERAESARASSRGTATAS